MSDLDASLDRLFSRLSRFETCHPARPLGFVQTIDELIALEDRVALRCGVEAAERVVGDFVDKLMPAEGEALH